MQPGGRHYGLNAHADYGILRLSNLPTAILHDLGCLTLLFNDFGLNIWITMLLSTLCVVGFAFKFTEQVLWARMHTHDSGDLVYYFYWSLALTMRVCIDLFWAQDHKTMIFGFLETLNIQRHSSPFNSFIVMGMAIPVIGLYIGFCNSHKVEAKDHAGGGG
jgi:hypothetical protein